MSDFFTYSAYIGCICGALSGIGSLIQKWGWIPEAKVDVFEKICLTLLGFGLPFIIAGAIGFLLFIAHTWWEIVFK